MHVTGICTRDDDEKQRRRKLCKNHDFVEAAVITVRVWYTAVYFESMYTEAHHEIHMVQISETIN